MNLAPIQPGDIVRVEKRGRSFYAEVTERLDRALAIRPLSRETYHAAQANEVKDHWRKAGRPRPHAKVAG